MIEIPEAATLAQQISRTLSGKTIENVAAAASPHKFAWFQGDPAEYPGLLRGRHVDGALAFGGLVELALSGCRIVFGDGVVLRYYPALENAPAKHQLCLAFTDNTALVCTVQMYGGMWAVRDGEDPGFCHGDAKEKPSPLSRAFDEVYFASLRGADTEKLSVKAFLATGQRIPGLGNGVLQDILWNARIHPKRKLGALSAGEFDALYRSVKNTLAEMTALGGRGHGERPVRQGRGICDKAQQKYRWEALPRLREHSAESPVHGRRRLLVRRMPKRRGDVVKGRGISRVMIPFSVFSTAGSAVLKCFGTESGRIILKKELEGHARN